MDINTAKIKYIVAREGLIIIFLLVSAGISYYANSWQSAKIDDYAKNAKEIVLETCADYWIKGYLPVSSAMERFMMACSKEKTPYIISGTKTQFPKSTPDVIIEFTLNRDFQHLGHVSNVLETNDQQPRLVWSLNVQTNLNIRARYDDKGNKLFTGFLWNIDFEKVMVFFLFISYPVYLLIRFIVWASLTVLNKNK